LDRAEEIVAVDGVDMVLVGLNDLLADWGIPGEFDHPRVRETYAKTIATCRKHGKHCGVGGLATRPHLVAEFVKMGARYVSTRSRLPAERLRRARATGQGDQALMSAQGAVEAARVYVEAGAADAFARRLLVAHGVPEDDAAIVAACLVGA